MPVQHDTDDREDQSFRAGMLFYHFSSKNEHNFSAPTSYHGQEVRDRNPLLRRFILSIPIGCKWLHRITLFASIEILHLLPSISGGEQSIFGMELRISIDDISLDSESLYFIVSRNLF